MSEDRLGPAVRGRLVVLVSALALFAAWTAQVPAMLGLTLHDADASILSVLAWLVVGGLWVFAAWRHARSADALWRLPSRLFRSGLAAGTVTIVGGRAAALGIRALAPAALFNSIEAALYQLGVIALASLAAFAASRSLLRPVLATTRPPVGARDIALRTRVLVATTGSSFATAGILLNVLIDFESTPPATLMGFLGTAAALVGSSALIGWLVGEDTARGVEAVTARIRELVSADERARVEVPVTAADEVGDLTLAASALERRIRREEATAATASERERIARELHDGVAKSVSVLSLEVASLAARAPEELRPPLARIEHLARMLAEELRAIVHEFRARPEPEPFDAALRRAVGAHDGGTIIIEGALEDVGTLTRFEVLRVVEEAIRNAERHADPTRIAVRLSVDDHALHLMVDDDGIGIGHVRWSELAAHGHFGLLGMRERASLLGGELRVEACPSGGTRVALDIPLEGRRG